MKKRKAIQGKKGINQMVATVLLIAFVVALIILIILWGKNYIEELAQKRGALAQKQERCTQVAIGILGAEKVFTDTQNLKVVIKNKQDISIHKFAVKVTGQQTDPIEVRQKLGGLETKEFLFPIPEDMVGVTINEIEVIPHLQVARGHYVPCSKQKISAKVFQ